MDWARCYFIHPVVIEYVLPRTIVSTSCTQWFSTVSFPTNYGNPKFLSKKGVCSWDSINANLLSLCLLWLFFSELDSNLCSHSMQLFVWKPISFLLKLKLFRVTKDIWYCNQFQFKVSVLTVLNTGSYSIARILRRNMHGGKITWKHRPSQPCSWQCKVPPRCGLCWFIFCHPSCFLGIDIESISADEITIFYPCLCVGAVLEWGEGMKGAPATLW